jgi:tRNA (mo5U34)-methyltransferase
LDAVQLERAAARINWFHTMDLGQGVVTRGTHDTPAKLGQLNLPASLAGETVLDIGAWDGFFSFEAERRGAKRVLATDSFSWGRGGWGSKEGFQLAREALGSQVDDLDVDVLDLDPDVVGRFDLVLFLGVLYHMRHPLLALERVASVTRRRLILETHVERLAVRRPALAFYPNAELNEDPSNWFGPNLAAVRSMLLDVGFERVELAFQTSGRYTLARMGYRAARGLVEGVRQGRRPRLPVSQARAVFHAYRAQSG